MRQGSDPADGVRGTTSGGCRASLLGGTTFLGARPPIQGTQGGAISRDSRTALMANGCATGVVCRPIALTTIAALDSTAPAS